MKEYYKIGEISNLYGIGTDSLRYYEEIGILKPKRDDNGYRMYGISDIRTLNILRDLRSIGFSMGEIKTHLENFDLGKTVALFKDEIDVIDEKILQLEKLKDQLAYRIDDIKRVTSSQSIFNKPIIEEISERKVLSLTENIYRDEDLDFVIKKLQKQNEDQLYLIGNSDTGATIPLDYLMSGNYGHFTNVFSVMAEGLYYDAIIPAGKYLTMTVQGDYSKIPAAWEKLFSYMKNNQLSPIGNPMELYIIDNHDTNNPDEYITTLQLEIS